MLIIIIDMFIKVEIRNDTYYYYFKCLIYIQDTQTDVPEPYFSLARSESGTKMHKHPVIYPATAFMMYVLTLFFGLRITIKKVLYIRQELSIS